MARPKRLTKSKVSPILGRVEEVMKDYVSSKEDVKSIMLSIKEALDNYISLQSNARESHEVTEEIAQLSGVVDPRNLARTGSGASEEGFYVRTKSSSEKSDGNRGL